MFAGVALPFCPPYMLKSGNIALMLIIAANGETTAQ